MPSNREHLAHLHPAFIKVFLLLCNFWQGQRGTATTWNPIWKPVGLPFSRFRSLPFYCFPGRKILKLGTNVVFISNTNPEFQIRKCFDICYRWSKSVIELNSPKGYSVNSVEYGSSPATVYHVTESRGISIPSRPLCSTSHTVI